MNDSATRRSPDANKAWVLPPLLLLQLLRQKEACPCRLTPPQDTENTTPPRIRRTRVKKENRGLIPFATSAAAKSLNINGKSNAEHLESPHERHKKLNKQAVKLCVPTTSQI